MTNDAKRSRSQPADGGGSLHPRSHPDETRVRPDRDPVYSEAVRAHPRPTLREIANRANVAESTASRALGPGGERRVNEATRSRILEAAGALGYESGPAGRRPGTSRRLVRRRVIGLVVRDVADPFFPNLVRAVMSEAQASNLSVLVGYVDSSAVQARALEEILETRRCEGIMLLGDVRDALLSDLQATSLPLVGLCGGSQTKGIPFVNSDNRGGTRDLMLHLVSLGHTRIAFATSAWDGDVKARERAYLEYGTQLSLDSPPEYLQEVTNDASGGYRAFRQLIELPQPPTAIMAGTDHMAIGCLQAAWRSGLRVPEDISITGFDDIPLSAFMVPSLTTMRQPLRDIARAGLALLFAGTVAGESTPDIPAITPLLQPRESTGPAPTIPLDQADVARRLQSLSAGRDCRERSEIPCPQTSWWSAPQAGTWIPTIRADGVLEELPHTLP